MPREFHTWPHTARKIVEESLREFVGDGDGEDYEVLTAFINEVQAEALHDAARAAVSDSDDCIPWSHDHDRATVATWLDARADRLKRAADRD